MSLSPTPQPRQRHAANARISSGKPGRRGGSVRFADYYKIQLWEARSFTWKDEQRSYDTPELARAAAEARGLTDLPAAPESQGRFRIMHITPTGRAPLA